MRVRPSSTVTRASLTMGACALLALTSGCGLLSHDAGSTSSQPAPTTTTDAAAAPAGAGTSVDADLVGIDATARPASLQVEVPPPTTTLPAMSTLGGLMRDLCKLPDGAVQVATVSVTFTDRGPTGKFDRPGSSNLRAEATVEGADGAAVLEKSDIQRSPNPEAYCPGGARSTPETGLQTQELAQSHQTMTLLVTAPTSPTSPNPLQGATLRLHDLAVDGNDMNGQGWAWGIEDAKAGVCPDDPNALCLPLS